MFRVEPIRTAGTLVMQPIISTDFQRAKDGDLSGEKIRGGYSMNWLCPVCKKPQKASPHVDGLIHIHNGQMYHLKPFKHEIKPRGVDTVKSLKKEVWDLFSEWVRRSESDENGYCKCVTCGRVLHWKEVDAGHYISRKHNSVFIDERNVHPQCKSCNGFGHGMEAAYKNYIIKRYGESVEATLQMLKRRNHQFTVFELQQYRKLYQEKLATLSGTDRKPVCNFKQIPF